MIDDNHPPSPAPLTNSAQDAAQLRPAAYPVVAALPHLYFPPAGQRIYCQKIVIDTKFRGPKVRHRHCKASAVTHDDRRLYCRMHDPERDLVAERSNPRRGIGPYY